MMRRGSAISLFVFLFTAIAVAADVSTTVTYVSASAVYIGAGSADGVANGNRVTIFHEDKLVAVMEVIYVAEKSASCQLLESTGVVKVGDRAVVVTEDKIIPQDETVPDTTKETEESYQDTAPAPMKKSSANRFTGRISAGVQSQTAVSDFDYSFLEPSLKIRASLLNIGGGYHAVHMNIRARRVVRDAENPDVNSEWYNRVYELALVYDNPNATLSYRAGRMIVNELRGIGYLDGAVGGFAVSDRITTGLFGGAEPELQNTKPDPDRIKAGVFAAYESPRDAPRLKGTLAFAGSYHEGEINREFFYQQLYYAPRQSFAIQQSLELNLNRDWLKDAEGSSTTLSSLFFTVNYSPIPDIGLMVGYDTRKNYHTFETRSIPDSLFDDAQRQGIRGSARVKFSRVFRWDVGGSGRFSENETDATTAWTTISMLNPLRSQINATASLRTYSSEYSEGLQTAITVSRPIVRAVSAGLQIGRNEYDLNFEPATVSYMWYRIGADARLGKRISLNAFAELCRGDFVESNGFGVEMGYRF